eukprot:COSAG04_NODE_466_length_13930_cov_50.807968_11_plen_228_part_00
MAKFQALTWTGPCAVVRVGFGGQWAVLPPVRPQPLRWNTLAGIAAPTLLAPTWLTGALGARRAGTIPALGEVWEGEHVLGLPCMRTERVSADPRRAPSPAPGLCSAAGRRPAARCAEAATAGLRELGAQSTARGEAGRLAPVAGLAASGRAGACPAAVPRTVSRLWAARPQVLKALPRAAEITARETARTSEPGRASRRAAASWAPWLRCSGRARAGGWAARSLLER